MNAREIEDWIVGRVAEVTGMPVEEIDRTASFPSMGVDSLNLFRITGELAEWLGRDLEAPLLWQFSTVGELAQELASATPAAAVGPIPSVDTNRPQPLSFSQERLWRYARHDEQGDNNLLAPGFILQGPLDMEIFRRSIDRVVERHAILRTTFTTVEGEPVQIVHPAAPVPVEEFDLRSEASPAGKAVQLLFEEGYRPMHLDRGPLFRVILMHLGENHYRLAFPLHHLLYDASSIEIFYRELGALYAALKEGRPDPLGAPPVQMADFATWQRKRLERGGEYHGKLLAWWKDYWEQAVPPLVELPFRWETPPAAPSTKGTVLLWTIPHALYEAVKSIGRETGASHFSVFFAAFAVLVHKLTGGEEMRVGTYVTDRTVAVKNTIGVFVNMLPVRIDLRAQPTFLEITAQLSRTLQQAALHGELPFEDLVSELQREEREVPWVNMIFQHVQDPKYVMQLAGAQCTSWDETVERSMPWGLSMQMYELPEKMRVRMAFDAGVYDPAGMAELLDQYKIVLAAVIANPDVWLGFYSVTGK